MEIRNRFDAHQSLESPTDWDSFKEETLEAARQTIEIRPRNGGGSLSAEVLAAGDESYAARLVGDKRRDRELLKRNMAQLQADRERVVSELAREVEDGFNRNNLRPAYRVIKRLSSVPAPAVSTLHKEDGTVVMGP